ncbi:hypothetical protein ABIE66_001139 [Peribacillus sp. B2I2]
MTPPAAVLHYNDMKDSIYGGYTYDHPFSVGTTA